MIKLNDDGAAAWHIWFAWRPVLCADINRVRLPQQFFITKWLTHVYRRSAPKPGGRNWVYCYEDPYEGYEHGSN